MSAKGGEMSVNIPTESTTTSNSQEDKDCSSNDKKFSFLKNIRKLSTNTKGLSSSSSSSPSSSSSSESESDGEIDEEKTYITVENEQGHLEHVPVTLDDSQFATHTPILNYLAEVGEIQNAVVKNDNKLKQISSEELELELDKRRKLEEVVDEEHPALKTRRSNSILTPKLINSIKKSKKRITSKNGSCNVELKHVPKKRIQFLKDVFTTAIDMPWRYTLLSFAASFFLSWLIFAVIWFIIAYLHGDLEIQHLPGSEMQENGTWIPCVWQIKDFTSCFLFSIETQHTIGYGSRSTSEECPSAIIIMCVQSILGVIISACMAGIVFAKLARPKSRSHTIMFSKNAAITQRNGDLYLLFRVGNMRKSTLIEAHLRAQIIRHKDRTDEGETLSYDHEELKISTQSSFDEDRDYTLLIWPITIAHKIDSESPFYSMRPKDILKNKFEILVSLEGTVEPTGNSVQARSSYLPNEILWGYRFESMVGYSKRRGVYTVDCANLNALVPDNTPRISAKVSDESKKLRKRSFVHTSIQGRVPTVQFAKSSPSLFKNASTTLSELDQDSPVV